MPVAFPDQYDGSVSAACLMSPARWAEKHRGFRPDAGRLGVGEVRISTGPIIGPRTTRDTFGWAVDTYADPVRTSTMWRRAIPWSACVWSIIAPACCRPTRWSSRRRVRQIQLYS